VYIQQSPVGSWTGLPYRSEPDIEITEGPHMGYAIQWFTFAVIIAAGYPILIRKRMNNQTQRDQQNNTISTEVVHDRSVAS
jgi:surfeit locus 1 family protein